MSTVDYVGISKRTIWNKVVKKVNVDIDGSRKNFWAANITCLKSDSRVSAMSTRGQVRYYKGTISIWGRLA